jgi:hypothetical protein
MLRLTCSGSGGRTGVDGQMWDSKTRGGEDM